MHNLINVLMTPLLLALGFFFNSILLAAVITITLHDNKTV